jgi:hypothetical protein
LVIPARPHRSLRFWIQAEYHRRRKQSKKRACKRVRLELSPLVPATSDRCDDLLDIDTALIALSAADPQAAELVEPRYFAGLNIPQAAASLGI